MKLVYKNLVIRDALPADSEQLCSWWCDGKIMAQFGLPNGAGCTPEGIRESFGGNANPKLQIIELDGKPIGEMSYRNFCYPDGVIELDGKPIDETDYRNMNGAAEPGIKICDFSVRDKGHGTTLLTIYIDALFRYYGYERIIIDTDMKNERARHVYEKKLGFRFLGTQKNSSLDESDYYETVIYFEMNKADWFASQKEPLEYIHIPKRDRAAFD